MMKSLRSLVAIGASLAALLAGPSAPASDYKADELIITNGIDNTYLTNTVAAASTNSSLAVGISCKENNHLALSIRTKLAGSGSTAVNYLFTGTVDGTNYSSATYATVSVTPNGTTAVQTITNLDVSGLAAIRLESIQNPNASALTNLQFNVGRKKLGTINLSP